MTNPENDEVKRALFEQWVRREFPRAELNRFSVLAIHKRAGEYEYINEELMWRAWVAAYLTASKP